MNQVREVIQARIDNLMRLSDVASTVGHAATIGQLRESYLMEFFRELVPANVSLTTGFVSDANGNISTQFDFIVAQQSSLPLISMKDQLSVVPVESALLVAEIKSSLTTADLDQVSGQNQCLSSMKPAGDAGSKPFIIPTIIVAYENQVASATMEKWLKENGNTVVCCVFNGDTFIKDNGIRRFEKDAFGIKHHGVLAFIATVYRMIEYLDANRDFKPSFDIYLTGRPRGNGSGS
jgi:hypothetical protein